MSEKKCFYCGQNPGVKPENKFIWRGFLDLDTKQLVCFSCRKKHYIEKSKTEHKDLYSEYPVLAIE